MKQTGPSACVRAHRKLRTAHPTVSIGVTQSVRHCVGSGWPTRRSRTHGWACKATGTATARTASSSDTGARPRSTASRRRGRCRRAPCGKRRVRCTCQAGAAGRGPPRCGRGCPPQAQLYADAAGVQLGAIVHIEDVDPERLREEFRGHGHGQIAPLRTWRRAMFVVSAAVALGFSIAHS